MLLLRSPTKSVIYFTEKITEVLEGEQNKRQKEFCKNGWVLFCVALGLDFKTDGTGQYLLVNLRFDSLNKLLLNLHNDVLPFAELALDCSFLTNA